MQENMQNPALPEGKAENERKAYRMPRFAWVLYGIAAFALVVYLIAAISPAFAAFVNETVGAAIRVTLATLTVWLPFSLAEFLLYLAPVVIVVIAVYTWRRHAETWGEMFKFLGTVVSVFSILFSLFVFAFGTGHHTETLDKRLGMTAVPVTASELHATATILATLVNETAGEIAFGEDGFSVMPYDIDEMNDKLLAAYEVVSAEHTFIQSMHSRVKPVLASKAMSYTHITGVYSYYTGEANINVYFPDYTIPFTAAHELAHQRGIARENEANFVAFLVTSSSSDPYVRYSAYLNMFEYVGSALYRADPEAYVTVLKTLSPAVIGEMRAYAAFFEQFEDSFASKVSGVVNDTYLKLNGNEAGTASYGLVVDLAVAYYKQPKNRPAA